MKGSRPGVPRRAWIRLARGGAPRPGPEWGPAISASRPYLPEPWWFAMFPGIPIFLVAFGFNLLGDGLRDVVDPRLRRSR